MCVNLLRQKQNGIWPPHLILVQHLITLHLTWCEKEESWWRRTKTSMCMRVHAVLLQSCLTLWDPLDCSPLGSSVCGILQARILEWVVIPLSRGSSLLRYQTQVSCMAGRFFTVWAIREEATQVEPLKSSRTESPQKWLWYLSTLVQSCLKILKTVQLREHWHWRPWHFYVHFWWRRIWSGHISDLFPWQRYPLKEKLFR